MQQKENNNKLNWFRQNWLSLISLLATILIGFYPDEAKNFGSKYIPFMANKIEFIVRIIPYIFIFIFFYDRYRIVKKQLLEQNKKTNEQLLEQNAKLNQEQINRIDLLEQQMKHSHELDSKFLFPTQSNLIMIIRDFIIPTIFVDEYFINAIIQHKGLYVDGLQNMNFNEKFIAAAKTAIANRNFEMAKQHKESMDNQLTQLINQNKKPNNLDFLKDNASE